MPTTAGWTSRVTSAGRPAGALATVLGLAAVLAVAPLTSAGAALPAAAQDEPTVVDLGVTPAADDLADGLAELVVDVHVRATSPLPDVVTVGPWGTDGVVLAEPVDGPVPPARPDDLPSALVWTRLERVSGTATDGTWRGSTLVSPVLSGSWLLTRLKGLDPAYADAEVDVSGLGVTVELGSGLPPWRAAPAPLGPIRVVTGQETWVPRARVTDRASGVGVAAEPWLDYDVFGEPVSGPEQHLPVGSALPRTDAEGYVTMSRRPIQATDGEPSRRVVLVYRDRGAAGYTWEARAVLWPYVKWQATQRVRTSGSAVVATGNVWPAPSVYPPAAESNPRVHLQHLDGGTWRIVATQDVRWAGGYRITWTPPDAGAHVVRVYKPGSTAGRTWTAGTTGPPVRVDTAEYGASGTS